MHADKKSASKSSNSKPSGTLQRHNETAGTLFQDNRPETIAQRKLQAAKDSMAETKQGLQWQEKANHETAASLAIQRKPLKKAHVGPGVAQLAGHPEDLCILQGGQWVIKRIDKFEMMEYMRLREIENGGEGMRAEGVVIPHFKGPYTSYEELKGNCGFDISGKDELKMYTKLEGAPGPMLPLPNGKFLVVMENVTGGIKGATAPRDLKIGKNTSDDIDQERHGIGWAERKWKAQRHGWMDRNSPSKSLGFRDEDQWKKSSKATLAFQFEVKNVEENLSAFRKEVAGASDGAIKYVEDSLMKIYEWVSQSDTVYVGASILVTFNNEVPDKSTARLIDFEHPLTKDGNFKHPEFDQYKLDMLTGVDNIIQQLRQADTWRERIVEENRLLRQQQMIEKELAFARVRRMGNKINTGEEGNETITDIDL